MVAVYRRELTHRLALLGFLCFAIALSCGYVWWHAAALPLVLWFVQGRRARFVVLVAALAGLIFAVKPVALDFSGKPFRGVVTVLSMPYDYEGGSWAVATDGSHRYGVALKGSEILVPGQVLDLGGRQVPLTESRSAPKGLVAEIEPVGAWRELFPGLSPLRWTVLLRRRFVALAAASLPPDLAGAVDALCMGQGSGMNDDQWDVFHRTGTVSVVVASGMHASLAAMLILGAMRWTALPRHWKLGITFLLVLFYACAAGFHPPIVRGLVTALLAGIHYLFSREEDTLNSLGVAGLASLAFDRWAIFDPGLWLTLTAVGSLALFGRLEALGAAKSFGAWLWGAVEASAVVTAATAPLLAFFFGQVPVVGLVTNLLALPALEICLGASLLALLISLVYWPLAVLVMQDWVLPVLGGLVRVLEWVSTLPFACVYVGSFNPYWLVPIYGGAILYWRPKFVPAS